MWVDLKSTEKHKTAKVSRQAMRNQVSIVVSIFEISTQLYLLSDANLTDILSVIDNLEQEISFL